MRLHILPDEKIINRTVQYFECVWPLQNKYIILLPKNKKKCEHVDPSITNNIIIGNLDDAYITNVINNISSYCSVIIHYLSLEAAIFVNRIEHDNIMWIEWGGDMYNSFLFRKGFKIYSNYKRFLKTKSKWMPYALAKLILNKRREKTFPIRYNAVKKIKYFIPDSMYGEYPLFLSYYPEFSHLQYREFFYYPIQDIVGEANINRRALGSNIFVGNSASETNNHLDAIEIIKQSASINKVLVPLSYGGSREYVKYVLKRGKQILHELFVPIVQFMPLQDYNKFFYSASYFVYANYRQEAVGNILFAFYVGGKVFLRKTNPLYQFYKDLGLVVYSFEDISFDSFQYPLSDEDYINNKKIIENNYSNQRLLELIKTSFPNE